MRAIIQQEASRKASRTAWGGLKTKGRMKSMSQLCGCYFVGEVEFINLTPHPVVILTTSGEEVVIPPSGRVARVATTQEVVATLTPHNHNIEIVRTRFGEIENLPEPEPGVLYIVSTLVAQAAVALQGRQDVVAPDTGPQSAVRGEDGQIRAVRRLQTFA
jgi:hypothetical protein